MSPVLRGVDAGEASRSFALLGLLSDGDVDAALVQDGGGDDLAGAVGVAVAGGLAVFDAKAGGIAVAAPELAQGARASIRGGERLGVEAVAEAVAAAENEHGLAAATLP